MIPRLTPTEKAKLIAETREGKSWPWMIVEYGDGDSLAIHSDEDNRVCFMATHGGSREQWERIQANARLIAAAPELLSELQALVTAVRFADPPKLFNGVECHEARVPVAFIEGAEAALAKARGEA